MEERFERQQYTSHTKSWHARLRDRAASLASTKIVKSIHILSELVLFAYVGMARETVIITKHFNNQSLFATLQCVVEGYWHCAGKTYSLGWIHDGWKVWNFADLDWVAIKPDIPVYVNVIGRGSPEILKPCREVNLVCVNGGQLTNHSIPIGILPQIGEANSFWADVGSISRNVGIMGNVNGLLHFASLISSDTHVEKKKEQSDFFYRIPLKVKHMLAVFWGLLACIIGFRIISHGWYRAGAAVRAGLQLCERETNPPPWACQAWLARDADDRSSPARLGIAERLYCRPRKTMVMSVSVCTGRP